MSLNALEIGLVSEALARDLRGAVVQEVLSPLASHRVIIALRTPGRSHHLQIVLQGGLSRIGRIETRPRLAPSPHPFVMLLRRALVGLRVEAIAQLLGDRVVRLDFLAAERKGRLICELTSRHANLFFVDAAGLIAGSFYPNRSNLRKLVPGEPYVPPIPHPLQGAIENRFLRAESPEAAIEARYTAIETSQVSDASVQTVTRLLTAATRHLTRLRKKIEEDLLRAVEAKRFEDLGHVLKAHLHEVKRGDTALKTVDFIGAPVVIPLAPKLGPVANMQDLFRKAKRFDKATELIERRLAGVQTDLSYLASLRAERDTADACRLDQLAIDMEARFPFLRQGAAGRRGEHPSRLPYKAFAISGGRLAMVGRSAKDNDTLTLRHAKPFDLWLHVRGGTGSHVVVPMGRNEEPLPDLLIDAAHLAVRYSCFKDDFDVEVIYTRRRYVQKMKGAPPGSVRLLKEKTIKLRVEPGRFERIMGALTH